MVKYAKRGFGKISNPSDEGEMGTGTEAWNIAQYFAGYSIALPLRDLNELEDVARFGSVKLDEEMQFADDEYDKRRAEAVKRYWQKLRQIANDTRFKVIASDRPEAEIILKFLNELHKKKYFGNLLKLKRDIVNHNDEIEVNEEFLTILLDKLIEIKQRLLKILNNAGLIFRQSSEVDLDKMTNEFVQGG